MITGLLCFTLNGFKPCMTVFSRQKFVASLPLGTCTPSPCRTVLPTADIGPFSPIQRPHIALHASPLATKQPVAPPYLLMRLPSLPPSFSCGMLCWTMGQAIRKEHQPEMALLAQLVDFLPDELFLPISQSTTSSTFHVLMHKYKTVGGATSAADTAGSTTCLGGGVCTRGGI